MSFVSHYIAYASTMTDSPEIFHEGVAWTILSACAENVHATVSYGEVWPNLWVMLLAESGMFRKTVSMKKGVSLLPDDVYCYSSRFSPEFLLMDVSDNPAGMFFRDEFTGFLEEAGSKQYMSGAKENLMQLYDHSSFSDSTLKRGTIYINDPYFTMLTGTTPVGLLASMQWTDIEKGFLPRFLVIYVGEADKRQRPVSAKNIKGFKPMILKMELTNFRRNAKKIGRVIIPDSVMAYWNVRNDAIMTRSISPFMRPFLVRYSISAKKIAILSAVERGSSTMNVNDMDRGFAFVEKLIPRTEQLCAELIRTSKLPPAVITALIIKHIQKVRTIRRSELMRVYGLTEKSMKQIEKTLKEQKHMVVRDYVETRTVNGNVYAIVEKEYSCL